jgi:hypothetical protein
VSKQEIERYFPNLLNSGYSITSPATSEYNCIAWAANDIEAWWEPDSFYLSFWPDRVPREYSLDAYINVYRTLGYTVCQNAECEEGYEKIAIYVNPDSKPTHAARQLSSGQWTSKLGQLEDIEHNILEGLTGSEYGTVAVIMKRPKN